LAKLAQPTSLTEGSALLNTEVTNLSRHIPESYVDPDQAAAFLNTNRLKVIRMARSGSLPAYPLGAGKRRQWRFKLSELDKHMQRELNSAHPPVRQRKGE
jgi:excisionase family DNA binding protein